jgi:peptidyl-tRNA hydrolase, PTH1 family
VISGQVPVASERVPARGLKCYLLATNNSPLATMLTHLIAGLGNPGPEYAGTRHNIGFMAVDAIAAARKLPALALRSSKSEEGWKKKFKGLVAAAPEFILLKPHTFMNNSGESVLEAMRFHKLRPENVIVFHDDLDLKPGQVKIKQGGGNAGHNGLKSCDAHIGPDYWRVRLGIGHPCRAEAAQPRRRTGIKGDAVLNYVLSPFAKADHQWLDPLLAALAGHFDLLLAGKNAEYLKRISSGE